MLVSVLDSLQEIPVLVSLVSRGRELKSHQLSARIKNKLKLQKKIKPKSFGIHYFKDSKGPKLVSVFLRFGVFLFFS